MLKGKIKWFNRSLGYGFIIAEDGGEVMVHMKALEPGVAGQLDTDIDVEYTLIPGTSRAATCRSPGQKYHNAIVWRLPPHCSHKYAVKLNGEVVVVNDLKKLQPM